MGDSLQYFLGIDGEQVGPYTKEEIFEKIRLKEVQEADMIWWEGQPEWLPLSATKFLKPVNEKTFERKRPKIGGDVENVLSGKSELESHPTFAKDSNPEPAFKMSHSSNRSFIHYRTQLQLTVIVSLLAAGSLFYFYYSKDDVQIKPSLEDSKRRNLKDRQAAFSKAVSTLMTNSPASVSELQNLIKENPVDEIARQSTEQLTSFFRTMQRYGEAGHLMMQVNRPEEAIRFFSLDPSLVTENENATWEAYKKSTGEDKRKYLLHNIQILVGQMHDIPRALERIKILEREYPGSAHPYGYYLKGIDEKISDLFSRTSFYFVQNLIAFLNSELPQLKLAARPLVEIKKSKTELYKIVGSYRGDVILNQDKLVDIFFKFWFANETWHIVDTNLTKERRAFALKEKSKISSLSMPGEAMLRYMEGVFRAQFPKVALHEVVDAKK